MKEKTKPNPWQLEKDLDRIGAEGIVSEYDDGTPCRIGSVESPLYKQTFAARYEALRAKYKSRDIPEAVAEQAFNEIYSQSILLGWEGMVDPDGKPLEYSPAAAEKALAERPRFRAWVVAVANDRKAFMAALEDEARKNSSTASSGVSNGAAVVSSSEKPQ